MLTITKKKVDDLIVDPANARIHDETNLDAIKGSLARFGQAEPLVVQKKSGRIIGGHGRLVAMKALGWKDCDVVEMDIDDLGATALGIALNRTAELADWDDEGLSKILEQLSKQDALDGTGYDDEDVQTLIAELEARNIAEGADAGAGELPEKAVTKKGDLWILGNHRLLCGDSGSRADMETLLGGARIHMVNTDPPYNVKVEPRSNNAIAAGLSSFKAAPKKKKGKDGADTGHHHQRFDLARNPGVAKPTGPMRAKDRPLANDFVTDEAFAEMLLAWFGNLSFAMVPGAAFYIWGGYANVANYPPALIASQLYFSQAIIWVMGHPVLTRKDYMGNHEWCFYGWKEGAGHKFYGPNNVPDVWEIQKVSPQKMVHLTEKPVELAVRAIEYSSRRGENVLDLFGGSGSTIMACEQTGRAGFSMELDEAYCDVIVDRWQRTTGGVAKTAKGRPFDELSADRA